MLFSRKSKKYIFNFYHYHISFSFPVDPFNLTFTAYVLFELHLSTNLKSEEMTVDNEPQLVETIKSNT